MFKRTTKVVLLIVTVAVISTSSQAETPVCYSCFFQDAGIQPDQKLIPYFQSFKTADALVAGDVRFILWRATGKEDCGVRFRSDRSTRVSQRKFSPEV